MSREQHKIFIVTQPTRLEELRQKFNTTAQAKFYVECLGADFEDYLREDDGYRRSLDRVRAAAGDVARVQTVPKACLPNLLLGEKDVVIALGRDGLVANTMKYLRGQQLLGVNPDPERWDGRLLPFRPGELERVLPQVLQGRRSSRTVTMARAETRDGQVLYAANDFFLGIRDHRSARYELRYRGQREYQCSSGVIVSTGLGMTGWHASVMAQARGMARALGLELPRQPELRWEDRRLRFCVREPYPSRTTGTELVWGEVGAEEELILRSDMARDGVLFSDGVLDDAIAFSSGMEVRISVAGRQGRLVI